ncbi:MAG: hypothetical protein LCI02_25290 [Proteobacteria bacterium]|nr:hypothetical protein [Pseudomonadota bacterium]
MTQKQKPDYAKVRKDLASYDDDQLIGPVELAALLATTAGMIYRYLYANPTALPPNVAGFGRKRVWRLGSCRDWLRQLAGSDSAQTARLPSSKRIGRPRTTDATHTPTR